MRTLKVVKQLLDQAFAGASLSDKLCYFLPEHRLACRGCGCCFPQSGQGNSFHQRAGAGLCQAIHL